ncbi:MAG: hypothetical protein WAT09_15920 [Paracoccaceae bacterium]
MDLAQTIAAMQTVRLHAHKNDHRPAALIAKDQQLTDGDRARIVASARLVIDETGGRLNN